MQQDCLKFRVVTNEEIHYLKSLEEKILFRQPIHSDVYGHGISHNWIGKLHYKEVEKIKTILQECEDLVIRPCSTNFGFVVSFRIEKVDFLQIIVVSGGEGTTEFVMIFSERTLPKSVSPDNIFEICHLPENKELVEEKLGLEEIREYSHYAY